jgi:NitT/TauT family transport system permease protein
VGLPLAYAVGEIRFLDRVLSPYLWGLFSTPRIILLPLIMLWAGITDTARIVLIVISVVPSLAVVVMEGVKTVDPSLLRAARVFGASKLQLLRHVVIPSTIPVVGTGVRMGMLRGLIALYVGELFVTSHGIGALMAYAAARFRTARVFAVLLIFIVFSVAVLAASRFVEARMSKWRAGPEGQVF